MYTNVINNVLTIDTKPLVPKSDKSEYSFKVIFDIGFSNLDKAFNPSLSVLYDRVSQEDDPTYEGFRLPHNLYFRYLNQLMSKHIQIQEARFAFRGLVNGGHYLD